MIDLGSSATARFSTADLPEKKPVAIWRDQHGRTLLRAHVEPVDDASYEATVASRTLPGLQLVSGRFNAGRTTRTREMMAVGNDDLYLFVNQTGDITVSVRGRELALGENDAVLISSDETVVFDRRTLGESITTRIPYAMLVSMMPSCIAYPRIRLR